MSSPVYVFDPTANDQLSKVRGVGRYLQLLRENFKEFTFTNDIKQIGADSIFINPFFNFLQPPLVDKRIATRQIAVIHDLITLKYPSHFPAGIKGKWNINSNKKTLASYDVIITDSEASKKDIVEILKIDENKIKVIYPCLPKVFTNPKVKNQSKTDFESLTINSKFCIYVGDATWNKNLSNIAKALKLADADCVFVGKVFLTKDVSHPWQKDFAKFLELAKGDPRFHFPGFIKDQELINLYQKAECNLLLSRDEGFGFSYLEASSLQTPSILADVSVLREIAQDTALFADPEDPQQIAGAIKKVFQEEGLGQTLGQEAQERSKLFSPGKFRQEFLLTLSP